MKILVLSSLVLAVRIAAAGVIGSNGVYAVSNAPAQLVLAWNAETDPAIAGYNLYQGIAPRTYTNLVNVGKNASIALTITRGITNFFAVTAYTVAGLESDFSAELAYIDTNGIPVAPTLKPPVLLVAQQKIGTNQWQNVYELSLDPSVAPQSEFRLLVAYTAPPSAAAARAAIKNAVEIPLPPGLKR